MILTRNQMPGNYYINENTPITIDYQIAAFYPIFILYISLALNGRDPCEKISSYSFDYGAIRDVEYMPNFR